MNSTPTLSHAPLTGAQVTTLHDRLLGTSGWPASESALAPVPGHGALPARLQALWQAVATNHRFNARLWAEEDLARRTQVADAEIAANKRAIDRYNQARNDATERVDEILLVELGLVDEASARTDAPISRAPTQARLNSETAGSMVDRLSILALKLRAMRDQAGRTDVDEAHRALSRTRLAQLERQRGDLAGCLDALLQDALAGRATFKVYRQFKMYNDARFNPVLQAEQRIRTPSPATGTGAMPPEAPLAGKGHSPS
ncbi:MAG: hypothetical protein RI988_3031 [Pseudomonadota bacterium]|jgi:hypothetical protein